MNNSHSHSHVNAEKSFAAAMSVLAAVGLTTFKLIVGLMTNSLGILAEAAHSALDLMAAILTYFTVQVSDKPADAEHPFGHGKLENISALLQTVLLWITSGWIIYEAIRRLLGAEAEIQLSIWAFIVMGVSMVVDYSRARILKATAEKHHSQALEADALHFTTDIWASGVVVLGLVLVYLSSYLGIAWLAKADAVAALLVAILILYVSAELGKQAIQELLDAAPQNGIQDQIIAAASQFKEVTNVHALRMRSSGAQAFVDMHVTVPGTMTVKDSHDLTELIEKKIAEILPKADITIHVEPDGLHEV